MKCICGSTNVIRYGIKILRTGKFQMYCCNKCGRRLYDKDRKIGDIMADKSVIQKEQFKEDMRKYQREYYRRTPKQQEIVKMYDKLKKVKKSIEGIRDMVMVRGTKKMGNACRVSLPKSWLGKEVLVIDTKLFEKDIRKSRV